MTRLVYFFALAMNILAISAWAAVPQQINYQGYLTDTGGNPLDTTVAMTFTLYDAATLGTQLWTETQPSCTVRAGLFNVLLGSFTVIPDSFHYDEVWLGITVGGNSEMTPRSRIVSVGYAYRVGTIDGASGGTISGDVNIVGKANIGTGNINSGTMAFVTGQNNRARGVYSVVAGGGGAASIDSNSALGANSVIAGGSGNLASGGYSTVGGGYYNTASGTCATVAGGQNNDATEYAATVGGGQYNDATEYAATVGGGLLNVADATCATIGGGYHNDASGYWATVLGGAENTAAGSYSFAAGRRAKANHDGAFVWGDSYDGDITSSAANQFRVRASGGTTFYSNTALDAGVYLAPGANAWAIVSDSTKKRNLRLVDTKEILVKVSQLPIKQWSYKSQGPSIEHIGPMAQDFWKLFGLGDDSLGISTIDPDGIALAAIQELNKKVEEVQVLKTQNAKLEDRVARLEILLQQLCGQESNSIKQASFTQTTH